MRLLQDLLDRSKQLNQTPLRTADLPYHAPNKKYKIIHHALIIPNLSAPLHYLNFFSLIGQPNVPMLQNLSAIQTTALDTAMVMVSTSPHMVGQFSHYSIHQACQFSDHHLKFATKEQISGCFPKFHLLRQDNELSLDLMIITTDLISYFTKLRMGLADHWSVLCHCEGEITYKNQKYEIASIASFEYARSINFPYGSFAFYSYQIINLSRNRQILLMHIRNRFNQVVRSRIYLRDLDQMKTKMFDGQVYFAVKRFYPKIKTVDGHEMYLAREFEWHYQDQNGVNISIQAQSHGDYKFGLAAGFVGSFNYQINMNEEVESGAGGYCEYIDCRDLRFQEEQTLEKNVNKNTEYAFNLYKK